MRLIDADALIKTIRENDYLVVDYFNSKDRGMFTSGILQAIDEQPSAQPERKTGKWLRTDKYDINGNTGWECSCCGNITACNGVYCHACGAKMKGVEQERRTDEIN